MGLVDDLVALKARRILRLAAAEGRITALECAMPECSCPEGRGYFEPCGTHSLWAPTPDRWPVAGIAGGEYVTSNVRLAHFRCNSLGGARISHERMGEWWASDELRERGRRLGLERGAAALRRWNKTPAGIEHHRTQPRENLDAAAKRYTASPEGRAFRAELGRITGPINMCSRWNIKRGKPCVCGHHTGSAAK